MNHNTAPSSLYFGIKDRDSVHVLTMVYVMVGSWFIAALVGGAMGQFNRPEVPPLALGAFLLVPLGGFTLAYWTSPRLRHALDQIPLWLLTISHVWRFVGLGFVVGTLVRVLPPQFGYPEGIGDVLAAVFCIPLALSMRRNHHSPRLRVAFVAWNVFGLIDLLSAISMGVLYSNGPIGTLRTGPSTELMITFPVSIIPTFFVPLFILLHLLSLKRSKELA